MKSPCKVARKAVTNKRSSPLFFQNKSIQAKSNKGPGQDTGEQQAETVSEDVVKPRLQDHAPLFFKPVSPQNYQASNLNSGETETSNSIPIPMGTSHVPLDFRTRTFMEQRFGHDFSDVRVHNDSFAHQSSEQANAHAYTFGNHIVFGQGEYQPNIPQGKQLIAHELTHVLQQRNATAPSIQKKRKRKIAPLPTFYDELEKEQKSVLLRLKNEWGYFDPLGEIPAINAFVDLARAIDKPEPDAISILLDKIVKTDFIRYRRYPSDGLVFEMISRLIQLGLDSESTTLREWYVRKSREDMSEARRKDGSSSDLWAFEKVHEKLDRMPANNAKEATVKVRALFIFFKQLSDEFNVLGPGSAKYIEGLITFLIATFRSIQVAYQVVLEEAIDDMTANPDAGSLKTAEHLLVHGLLPLIKCVVGKGSMTDLRYIKIETTRSEFEEKASRHLDIFEPEDKPSKRSIKITFYSTDSFAYEGREVVSDFFGLYRKRMEQISALKRIYGVTKDPYLKKDDPANINQEAIRELPKQKLRLDNDDDWREFLAAKFRLHRAKSNEVEAFEAVVNLLKVYLNAFTVHSPYNIDDFVENPFTKKFPRALSGQVIQDCGVYALRIAYLLSLIRKEPGLNLTFRLIALPVHVGLIISGPALPTYLVHNDSFTRYTVSEIEDLQKDWAMRDRAGNATAASSGDKEQFVAELAGHEFLQGVDLPFKVFDVPPTSGNSTTAKRDLWNNLYQAKVLKTNLFSKVNDDPEFPYRQFQMRYLEILDLIVDHHNNVALPFVNGIARDTWIKMRHPIQLAYLRSRLPLKWNKEKRIKQFEVFLEKYEDILKPVLAKVTEAYKPINEAKRKLNEDLQANPALIAKGIGLTAGQRMLAVIANFIRPGNSEVNWWSEEFDSHIEDLFRGNFNENPYNEVRPPIER